ncbi:hypothetical protein HID58_001069 [Brassica napus]|uniref:Uncharacterized protein n=1 Tax=Brassica napus TaxID=3708 RepID=A0ABQ7XAH3_BRANA|nr:hypothetical protein HID58_093586 [Brassica napus]KAH0941432.1 hypothetical protein HID58_001069 [Brassica napus]
MLVSQRLYQKQTLYPSMNACVTKVIPEEDRFSFPIYSRNGTVLLRQPHPVLHRHLVLRQLVLRENPLSMVFQLERRSQMLQMAEGRVV